MARELVGCKADEYQRRSVQRQCRTTTTSKQPAALQQLQHTTTRQKTHAAIHNTPAVHLITVWPWPPLVMTSREGSACWAAAMYHVSTKFGVDSSSHFPFRAWTHTHRQTKVTDAAAWLMPAKVTNSNYHCFTAIMQPHKPALSAKNCRNCCFTAGMPLLTAISTFRLAGRC